MFQGGALWSSLTLAENVAFPLEEFTDLPPEIIRETVELKLALVGLRGFEDFYPAEISGGMCKRASLARAMALDPEFLFFDEPSAGLDPVSARRLDDLILQLRDSLGTTIVIVTHELASIFAIADRAIYLDVATRTAGGLGNPTALRTQSTNENLRLFLNRGVAGSYHVQDPATGAPFIPATGHAQG
jgi:phospholipid/cholesterol/gamma-HCH transport system ATP-binding protein